MVRRSAGFRRLVAGVDGGGTATRAVILDDQHRVIAEGHAGPSNPLRVGIATAASAVRDAIDQACGKASIHRDDILAAAVGLAGVRRQDIRDRIREKLSECLKEIKPIELFTDGEIALYGATGGAAGLVVIAGTGSICCGRNSQGKHVCAGGWGPIVGDEGGGSWIARKALQVNCGLCSDDDQRSSRRIQQAGHARCRSRRRSGARYSAKCRATTGYRSDRRNPQAQHGKRRVSRRFCWRSVRHRRLGALADASGNQTRGQESISRGAIIFSADRRWANCPQPAAWRSGPGCLIPGLKFLVSSFRFVRRAT